MKTVCKSCGHKVNRLGSPDICLKCDKKQRDSTNTIWYTECRQCQKSMKRAKSITCHECSRKSVALWRQAHPAENIWKRTNFAARRDGFAGLDAFGTLEQFVAWYAAQPKVCAVCGSVTDGRGMSLHVDHSHMTGQWRFLVCHKHNTLIRAIDDTAFMQWASENLPGAFSMLGIPRPQEFPALSLVDKFR